MLSSVATFAACRCLHWLVCLHWLSPSSLIVPISSDCQFPTYCPPCIRYAYLSPKIYFPCLTVFIPSPLSVPVSTNYPHLRCLSLPPLLVFVSTDCLLICVMSIFPFLSLYAYIFSLARVCTGSPSLHSLVCLNRMSHVSGGHCVPLFPLMVFFL
jgi:hypothetical protein